MHAHTLVQALIGPKEPVITCAVVGSMAVGTHRVLLAS